MRFGLRVDTEMTQKVKTFGTDGTDEKDMNFEGPDGRMLGVELYALQIYKLKS